MTSRQMLGLVVVLIGLLGAGVAEPASAQGLLNRALAKREDLEGLLNGTTSSAKLSTRDRQAIERRLQDGDFQAGDRIYVIVPGEKSFPDTFTVKAGQILVLPDMAPLSLHGVLRSEIQDRLQTHIAQYVREPQVTARALIRIGILGAVVRPGYYAVPADVALGDVLVTASGPAGDADLKKTSVLRDGHEYWPQKDVSQAMASGKSLDLLGFQSGDEIQVGRRGTGFGPTLAILTGVATLLTTILVISRH